MTAIIMRSVCFGYQKRELVLQDVNFEVQQGQFFGIIGPNGGGKTTLLRLLLGFLQPTSGTILLHGETPPSTQIGYVPQATSSDKLFPITVEEVVLGGRMRFVSNSGRFSKKDHQIVAESLEKVGLENLKKAPYGSLSGGQAKRVLVARAFATQPSILLLDEPTSSSDPVAEISILNAVRALKGTTTVLMVTHNVASVLSDVEGIICVQHQAAVMKPQEICEHFALGLYHHPLVETPLHHVSNIYQPKAL
jgi:zinc transport system ATP-binding protein